MSIEDHQTPLPTDDELMTLIASAYAAVLEEYKTHNNGKPLKKPNRVTQVFRRFLEGPQVRLSALIQDFENTEKPANAAQTVISQLNRLLVELDIGLEFKRVVYYELMRTEDGDRDNKETD